MRLHLIWALAVLAVGCYQPLDVSLGGEATTEGGDAGGDGGPPAWADAGADGGVDGGQDAGSSCLDADGDGFIVSCAKDLFCPGLGRCDCDDSNPATHPGTKEHCANGLDDDCDSLVDQADPDCLLCASGEPKCSTPFDCQLSKESCSGGCCSECPVLVPPPCHPTQCSHPGGLSPSGCPAPPTCGACCSCTAEYAPVCGTNYATYSNPCQAACAQVPVLHPGPCLPGEGIGCPWVQPPDAPAPCGASGTMYCRETCPMCGGLSPSLCTQNGACTADWDCPAGLKPQPTCDGGASMMKCIQSSCVSVCG